jgi:hypothetical protein
MRKALIIALINALGVVSFGALANPWPTLESCRSDNITCNKDTPRADCRGQYLACVKSAKIHHPGFTRNPMSTMQGVATGKPPVVSSSTNGGANNSGAMANIGGGGSGGGVVTTNNGVILGRHGGVSGGSGGGPGTAKLKVQ